jgi:hypothetical protein
VSSRLSPPSVTAVSLAVLLDAAGSSLGAQPDRREWPFAGPREDELLALLERWNGFFAYGNALHIFPTDPAPGEITLVNWNEASLWKSEFGELADGLLFFASDTFGNQFAIRAHEIGVFNIETGDFDALAASFEAWIDLLTIDHRYLTGWPLRKDFEASHGPLAPPQRLVPFTPFVTGGAFDVSNLTAMDELRALRVRGPIAQGVHALPDGTDVSIVVVDDTGKRRDVAP